PRRGRDSRSRHARGVQLLRVRLPDEPVRTIQKDAANPPAADGLRSRYDDAWGSPVQQDAGSGHACRGDAGEITTARRGYAAGVTVRDEIVRAVEGHRGLEITARLLQHRRGQIDQREGRDIHRRASRRYAPVA